MISQLYKKLSSITALPPVRDNEIIIRNLVHRLLNEINRDETADIYSADKEKIRQCCLNCIRQLNADIILNSSEEDYVYEKYNLTALVHDTITACGVLLYNTDIHPVFRYGNEICLEFPLRPVISAIVAIVRLFYNYCAKGDIYFSLKKKKRYTVLLAECVNNKQEKQFCTDDISALLKKTGELTKGAFLTASKDSVLICALSFGNQKNNSKSVRITPCYTELLQDKMSEIHIGLSCLTDNEKISDLH